MTQKFQGDKVVPVTLIKVEPCIITKITDKQKDNSSAVQIGSQPIKPKKIKKSQRKSPFRCLRQFKTDQLADYKIGEQIDVSIFKPGEKISVSAKTKGRGFTGVMKRWGFAGQSATHGTKHDHRHAGSIGSTDFQRVIKGKKMAGRMGGKRKTVLNLKIIEIDLSNNLLIVKGAVPGPTNSLVEIKAK